MLRSEGLLEPSDSPGLERYRQAKAAQEEIKLAELRSEVVMLGDFEEIAQAIFQPLRAFGEHLKRGNDPELLDRLNEANENVLAGLDRLWNRNP